jgi:hypothetical protein
MKKMISSGAGLIVGIIATAVSLVERQSKMSLL